MAELVIQNPSITTNVFEYDEAGRVSAISGHPLAGEGGGEVVKSDLMWKPTVGSDGYVRWTLESSATTPDAAYISGAQGPQGNPGANGTNGTNGTNGKDGANGISPTFTITPTAGGTHVTISGAQGEDSFDVLSGAKGADGTAGFSPLFTITDVDIGTYPQGGKHVAIQYGDGGLQNTAFDILNGINGTGATVNLLDGTGIHIEKNGTNYTVGVSADYALKSYVDSASANAYDKAVAQIPSVADFITKDVNNLTYYYKKTETSGNTELSTEFAKKLEAPAANVGDFCIWQTTAQNPGWTDITAWWNTKSSEIVEYEYIPDTIIPQNGLSADWNTSRAELKFGLSAEYENAIKTVSAKSRTTINSDQVVITENNGTSATVSAVQYVTNDSFGTAPKQLFVCQDDSDLTAHLNICNGKGTLFFVCSAI